MHIIRWLLIGVRILVICFALYLLALIALPNLFFKNELSEQGTVTSMTYDPDKYELQLMSLDNNLPYKDYKTLSDSITQIKQLERIANFLSMDGWMLGFIGFHKQSEKSILFFDSSLRRHSLKEVPDTTYYIGLDGYYLKSDHSTFRRNDTTFLRFPVITKRDTIRKIIDGHFEVRPLSVDVQDLAEGINNPMNQKRELLIKVSKQQYKWFLIVFSPIAILLLLLFLWGVILQPIRILEDIANQEAFRKKTYKKLYFTTISLWGIVLLKIILSYSLSAYFSSYIDPAFHLRFYDFISESISYIIGGFITFSLAHAFRKGYQLQQDQNLTI
jgi:hypothetical protein